MGRVQGKNIVVTAAAQGIGKASAELLAREGATVYALDRNADALGGVAGCRCHVIDLLDASAIDAFAAQVGAIDVLFNCAGYVDSGTLLTTTDDLYDLSFELNVHAMTRVTRSLLPGMIARGGGSIINMASVAGTQIGVANRYAYCASKGAVAGLTRSIAVDYVSHGIRCNAICPGTVQSPSLDERLAATGDAVAAREAFISRQPMGRIGTADEIAALVLYLASDESAFMTGSLLTVDGGWSAS